MQNGALSNYDVVTFSTACSICDKSFVVVRISNDKSAYRQQSVSADKSVYQE